MTVKNTFDDLTVTTATRSEAEVRASLATPATESVVTEPAAAAAAAATAITPEQEAESTKPETELSEAGRTLRAQRSDSRKARLRDDNQLYEDNIRRLGGTVPALERREYPNAAAEIDHLSRHRHELLKETNRLLREPPKPSPAPKAADAAPAAPAGPPAPKPFAFPTFEDWQTTNQDKDYTDYLDARGDAREAWQTERRQEATQRHQAEERRVADERAEQVAGAKFAAAERTFEAEHPDYQTVLAAVHFPLTSSGAMSPQAEYTRRLALRSPEHAPKILYHLGQHPDDAQRLWDAPNMGVLLETFGEIKYAALKASGMSASAAATATATTATAAAATAPAASTPSKQPTSDAPAPLTEVKAGAHDTRTLAAIAADGEDADAYIAKRHAQQKRGG